MGTLQKNIVKNSRVIVVRDVGTVVLPQGFILETKNWLSQPMLVPKKTRMAVCLSAPTPSVLLQDAASQRHTTVPAESVHAKQTFRMAGFQKRVLERRHNLKQNDTDKVKVHCTESV